MEEYFVIAIEGIAYQFEDFEEALKEYKGFKALGYHEAILRKHSPDYEKPLIYSDRAKCFFVQTVTETLL